MFKKKFQSDASKHWMIVKRIERQELPARLREETKDDGYSHFYSVQLNEIAGSIVMYLAKGYEGAPKEIHGWYARNKTYRMWASYGATIQDTVEGMQKDGWLYA